MLLSLNNALKQYGGKTVFSDLSLTVNYGDKIGLVGINGSGKSTLIKVMAGEVELDDGIVTRKKGLKIGYVEQMHSVERNIDVYRFVYNGNEEIVNLEKKIEHAESGKVSDPDVLTELFEEYEKAGGYKYKAKVEEILEGIGVLDLKDKPVNKLSGGELRRVFLARVLVSDSDLFLFDEPTNHLDIFAVKWFRDFLTNCKTAYVLVSHDEYLLKGTVSKIIEINGGKAFVFNGDYSFYKQKRQELEIQAEKEFRRAKEEIERQMEFVRKNIAGQKTKQAKSRLKKIEKVKIGEKRLFKDCNIELSINETEKKSKYILKCENLQIGYDRPLIDEINLLVQRGEKYGVIGKNGSGKSTFLKTVMDKIKPLAGDVKIYPGIKTGYFDQHIEFDDEERTVLDTLWDTDSSLKKEEALNYLAYFYFRKEMVESKVKHLSGGERSRLKLACLLRGEYDLLVLDEPTNHLDILLTESVINAVKEFKGSVIAVSHHRYFLDSIVNRVIELKNGKAKIFPGGLDYYFQKVGENREKNEELDGKEKKRETKPVRVKKKTEISKNELLRAKWRLEEVEKDIEKLEERKSHIEQELNKSENLNDYVKIQKLSEELSQIEFELDRLLSEWQRLGELCM